MIVDCHTHIDCKQDDGTFANPLKASGTVDICVVLASPDGPSKDVNKRVSEYAAGDKEKTAGFAIVNPVEDKISVKRLTALKDDLGLKGTVLYCANSGFHPAHSRAMRFYEAAEELGLPVFFHNAWPVTPDAVLDYTRPFLLDEIARSFASLKIIIGGMGMPFVEQTLCMLAKHQNVYADLTVSPKKIWEVYNVVIGAYEQQVMDKLLFGSGFPLGDADVCIEALLGFNKLLSDTNLPTVPLGSIRSIIERDSLSLLGIKL